MQLLNIDKTDLDLIEQGSCVNVAGVILSYKPIQTRSGKKMAFIELDDSTGSAELILFPGLYSRYAKLELKEGDIITAKVKVESVEPDKKLIINKLNKYRLDYEVDR